MLEIKNLQGSIAEISILKGVSFAVPSGQIAALMGPNGSGKSTLASIIAGHPAYQVTGGSVTLNGVEILPLTPEERAAQGLFLGFQYPPSLPGVAVSQFLRSCLNAQEKMRGEPLTGLAPFIKTLRACMKSLQLPWSFAERSVNDGFSGGEKKRIEMLQMLILKPRMVILDEIDSGLDIDAIRIVAEAVKLLDPERTGVLAITHYKRLLTYLKPDTVYVMKEGRIVQQGGAELADELETTGYADR